uniref:Uncharacterized protein n=1 Tax=Gasterosteus aculeatus aculeatus TaxID=481459 RepID=A0AAQ4PWW1_GASAC
MASSIPSLIKSQLQAEIGPDREKWERRKSRGCKDANYSNEHKENKGEAIWIALLVDFGR